MLSNQCALSGRDCPPIEELKAHVVHNVKEQWFELCKELLGEHANNKLIMDDITEQYLDGSATVSFISS